MGFKSLFLARLFRRINRAIVIAASSLSSSAASCKIFKLVHFSKIFKGARINTKLGKLAHHDNMQLQGKGHNSESYIFIFGVMPF